MTVRDNSGITAKFDAVRGGYIIEAPDVPLFNADGVLLAPVNDCIGEETHRILTMRGRRQ